MVNAFFERMQYMKHLSKIIKRDAYALVPIILSVYIFTTEIIIAANFLFQYTIGLLLIRFFLRPNNNNVYRMYSIFYSIYGLLTLVTQFELISIIDENHYFVHNDAADAFYPMITDQSINIRWSEMINSTLFNPLYFNYPLSSLIFSSIGKIGLLLDVENLRLFLRMHEFLFAAFVVALITDIPYKLKAVSNKTNAYIVLFSLCSYLYITSSIFTRDMHACLAYSLLGYIFLLPNCKFRIFWFIVLIAGSAGIRPANGILASLFLFVYYLTDSKNTGIFIIIILCALISSYSLINQLFSFGMDSIEYYSDLTQENSSGGMFSVIYSLPFPINQILICIYILLLPLPITSYIFGPNESLMNLPFCLSPYIMSIIFYSTLYIAIRNIINNKRQKYFIYLCILLFAAIVIGSPDLRRAFAPIPCLFMAFICHEKEVPHKVFHIIKVTIWPIILIISLFLSIYVII